MECVKCVCVWFGAGCWVRGLDLGITNPVGTRGVGGVVSVL